MVWVGLIQSAEGLKKETKASLRRKKLAYEPQCQLLPAPWNSDSSASLPHESMSCNKSLGIDVSAHADTYLLKAPSLWSMLVGAKPTEPCKKPAGCQVETDLDTCGNFSD